MRGAVAITFTILALGVMPGYAADTATRSSTVTQTDQTALDSSKLSTAERVQARAWKLSTTEWRRYRALMQGIRGSISPATISPIEVLGIHARDAAERQRYAERWAELMREDVDRILAFQRAYEEAGRRLFPNEQLIDAALRAPRTDAVTNLGINDRVLLFVRPDCVTCNALLTRLLARLDRIAGIDVYLSGVASGNESVVRQWAAARAINPDWVRTRKLTLNFDAGTLARLAPGSHELPYLMRRRGNDVRVLPGSAL